LRCGHAAGFEHERALVEHVGRDAKASLAHGSPERAQLVRVGPGGAPWPWLGGPTQLGSVFLASRRCTNVHLCKWPP
jgi:hypothetical protein